MRSRLQRVGIRQLPGICWYPAKCTVNSVNRGGTADNVYSSLTENNSVKDFLFGGINNGRKNKKGT